MMDPSGLSSNWKKLQETLKSKDQPSAAGSSVLGKRKNGGGHEKAKSLPPLRLPEVVKKRKVSNGAPEALSAKHKRKISSSNGTIVNTSQPDKPSGIVKGSTASKSRGKNLDANANASNSNPRSFKMGLGASRPRPDPSSFADSNNKEDDSDASSRAPISTAIEDIPASQRSLVSKASGASLRDHKDTINSGLIDGVVVGRYIAVDCEMVGVGPNPNSRSMLARISIVNFHGEQVYDSFVAAKEPVTDYRTAVSGITEALLREARTFETVQTEVANLLDGRILVGHAVRHDLDALLLGHPKRDIRDTSRHPAYREIAGGRTPALKKLAKEFLGVEIQAGMHSSIEDARATMMLYRREKDAFERNHVRWHGVDRRHVRPQAMDGEVSIASGADGAGKGRNSNNNNNSKKKGKNKKKRKR